MTAKPWKTFIKTVLLLWMSETLGATAWARCRPALTAPIQRVQSTDYTPFSGQPANAEIRATLRNRGQSTCRLLVSVFSENSRLRLLGPSESLRFQIINSGGLRLTRRGDTIATQTLSLAARENSRILRIPLRIPARQIVGPGIYEKSLRLVITNLTNNDGPDDRSSDDESSSEDEDGIFADQEVVFEAHVDPHIEAKVSFARRPFDSSSSVDIYDLGILRSGLRRRLFLHVRGNTNAHISVQSKNLGHLKHIRSPHFQTIPYSLTVAGTLSLLQTPINLIKSLPKNFTGRRIPMIFTVRDAEDRRSGLYQDTIFVSVTSF